MIDAPDLAPFLVLALAGGLHCAGMCGAFAAGATLLPGRGRTAAPRALASWRRTGRFTAFALGKASTYAVLGAALSLVAHGAVLGALGTLDATPDARGGAGSGEGALEPALLGAARRILAWTVGSALIAIGLWQLAGRRSAAPRALHALGALFQHLFRGVRELPGGWSAFGSGLLVGFLPCGLSAGALILAIAQPPLAAALALFAFGVATAPALALVVAGASLWPSPVRRAAAIRLGAVVLVATGAYTLWRGGSPADLPASASAPAACCQEP